MAKIKVRFPEFRKKQRKIADEVRNTAYECAEELWEAMTSLNVLTVNALAAANSVIIPCQASYLSTKGLQQLMGSVARVRRNINPGLSLQSHDPSPSGPTAS